VIFLLDESRSRLSPSYLSLDSRALRAAEKLTGLKREGFSISIEAAAFYDQVIRERKPRFLENAEEVVRQVLPEPAKRFAVQIVKILRIPKSILAPLIVEDEVIGLLSVQSHDLDEEDVPAIVAFAQQLSTALENARQAEALRQKNAELERLYAGAQQHLRELDVLYSLSSKMREAESAAALLPTLLNEVQSTLGADSSAVALLQPDGEHFHVAQTKGHLASLAGYVFSVQEGISGHVLRTRQPYATADYSTDPHHLEEIPGGESTGPAVYVPLESETALVGVLALARFDDPGAEPFTPAEMNLLAAIGEMAGNALRRIGLFDEAQKRLKQVQALRNIDMAITGSLDPRLTLRVLLDEVTANLEVDAAAVLLFDPHTQTLTYAAGRGFHSTAIESTHLHLGEGYAGRAALERHVLSIADFSQVDDFVRQQALRKEGFTAYYAAPMIAKGRVLGVLETFHRQLMQTDGEWENLMEALAGQAAIAIENAQLFSDMEKSNTELRLAYDATIEGWSRAMDLRDKETEGHTQRVTELTLELTRRMGVSEERLVHVRRGALLHDMGKLGVPDHILLKPEKLTDEEWAIMRRHPLFAYEMLSPIEYLRPALEIPYCHHEKWDGSGYPRGLKGDQIPLEARIFAVVDVWDALMSDRPYREAWPREKALAHIHQGAGGHFDPQVVEMFQELIDEGRGPLELVQ